LYLIELIFQLIIHIGVHKAADSILIEKQSFNQEYTIEDIMNQRPANELCKLDGEKCLQTALDVNEICEHVNSLCESQELVSRCNESENPGK
jgi:hypothetical protein